MFSSASWTAVTVEKLSIFSTLCSAIRFDGRPSRASSSHVVFGLAVTHRLMNSSGVFLERNRLSSPWRSAPTAPLTRLGAASRRGNRRQNLIFHTSSKRRAASLGSLAQRRVSAREEPNPVWLSRLFILLTSQLCLPKIESLSASLALWSANCVTELQIMWTCCFCFFSI